MKKAFVAIIFTLASLFTFATLFVGERSSYRYELETIGEDDSAQSICFTALDEPEELYAKITGVLDRYGANLYVTRGNENDDQAVLVKYVYLNRFTAFEELNLVGGRFFSKTEKESDVYLSTDLSQSSKKIGLIDSYPSDEIFEIRPLKSGLDATLFNHVFVLQTFQVSDAAAIIRDWADEGISVTKMKSGQGNNVDFGMVYAVVASCLVIFSLVMFRDILRSHRRIAVEKTHGYSAYAIWKTKALPLLLIMGGCSIGVLLLGSFWIFKSWTMLALSFLGRIAAIQAGMLVLAVVFLTVPFIYIRRIRITEVLRNRKETLTAMIFNTCVKVLATTVLVIYSSIVLTQIQTLWSQYDRGAAQWQQAEDYYTVTAASVQEAQAAEADQEGTQQENTQPNNNNKAELTKEKEVYKYFNSRGAVYADFDLFASYNEPLAKPYQYKAVINPNYLKKHAVYDANDKVVRIDESRSDSVLLVPEALRGSEGEIREYYRTRVNAAGADDAGNAGNTGTTNNTGKTSNTDSAQLSIIWIKDGQSIFTYRFDINSDNGNCVDDVILQVLTEENGGASAYKGIAGYKGSPFKIRAENLASAQKEVETQFSLYFDAQTYRLSVTDVYDVAAQELEDLRGTLLFNAVILVVLLIITVLIMLQNIMGYISENRFRIAMLQTLGYHMIHKFLDYYVLALISWGIILSIALVGWFSLDTALLCGGLLVIEAACSWIIFCIIEKKNVVRIMKGG